jgi:hypothetical protein
MNSDNRHTNMHTEKKIHSACKRSTSEHTQYYRSISHDCSSCQTEFSLIKTCQNHVCQMNAKRSQLSETKKNIIIRHDIICTDKSAD